MNTTILDICSICLDYIKDDNQNLIVKPCSYSDIHCFHAKCIDILVSSGLPLSDKCPLCKHTLKNEFLKSEKKSDTKGETNNTHPTNHYIWKSFAFSTVEENAIIEQLNNNNFNLYDELRNRKKVPTSRFDYSDYRDNSIFKQLIDKKDIQRLFSLSTDIAYYPHDLDIIYSAYYGYTEIAKNLLNNQRFNILYSNNTMLYIELEKYPEVFQLLKEKMRI